MSVIYTTMACVGNSIIVASAIYIIITHYFHNNRELGLIMTFMYALAMSAFYANRQSTHLSRIAKAVIICLSVASAMISHYTTASLR